MPLLAARDWIAGTILWCYQDYKSPRNLWPGETEGYVEHGVVDEARQRKPSYEIWRQLTSPATIAAHWVNAETQTPTAFAVLVTPNSARNLPFYPLNDYRLIWKLVDEKGKSLGAGERRLGEFVDAVPVSRALPLDNAGHAFRLTVALLDPTGAIAVDETLEWPPQRHAGQQ
jgi:hypothetical protein